MNTDAFADAQRLASGIAERVRLPMRSRIWKGQAGEFAGSGSGSSIDFHDHRIYLPGDDPRHINWQAYARTGQHTMKLFREEVRPIIELIIDISRSMFYHAEKARLTAALGFLVIQAATAAGASIRVHTLTGSKAAQIDAARFRSHTWLPEALHAQDFSPPEPGCIELRPNSVRIFLSDLLYPGDPTHTLNHLGGRGSMLILLAPFLSSESSPKWQGHCDLIDVESNTHHPGKIDSAFLNRYHIAYSNHMAAWSGAATRHQAVIARIPAHISFPEAIFKHAVPAGAFSPI